ncbi:uncharacterized protein A1O9_03755 [Exophiala aquamarina CBS 119918]|uniref:Sequence orphan n=1 Tax=Exophiala aquamarina CBS 119918 TaxID=1182545 RepID=A0A072PGN6_9EURO|nr:uncharacterized protein A1O9_03755 [Exophiala aquamarina CBS 119918]KEF58912.1 hypothetical protein A1O9_03755 [Exophiala aquamarina CBS 119918]
MTQDANSSKSVATAPATIQVSGSQIPVLSVKNGRLEPGKVVQWDTANLGLRFAADLTSAATASVLIGPIISVIDRSIVEKAATGSTFSSCLRRALRPALTRPHAYLVSKPFLLIFALYFSTYATANTVDTIASTVSSKPASSVTSGSTKFLATSSVNMSICVYKDSQFAKLFGGSSSSPAAAIPRLSYALFAVRDSLTIFASFNLPPLIAPQLGNLPTSIKTNFSKILSTESGRANTAQFLAPAAVQLISTPIHLHGLDLYNRQGRLGITERASRVLRDWGVSAFARMGRIIPAFGVGGVVNANMRKNFMSKIEGQ